MSNESGVPNEEASAAIGGGEPTARVDPGFKRNVRVIGIVIVLAVIVMGALVVMMRSGAKAVTENSSNISLQDSSPVKSNDGLTPAMREKLIRAQTRESGEAGSKEQSYIPPDILPEKLEPRPAPNPAQQLPIYAQGTAVSDPNQDRRNQERLRAAEQMLAGMLQRPVVERVAIAKIDPPPAAAPRSAASAPVGGTGQDALVEIMEIFGARLTSPVDTDKSTYASAEITTGKLAGALLIGSVKLLGEGLEFKFTGMRFNRVTYPINAIALDAATSTSAIDGELDRKVLTRYVFPVVMAAVGGYATARSQVATTTTSMGYGSDYGVARPAPTGQQAAAAGVAAAVQIANQAVGQAARTPVRVSMAAGESIGVMFREVVMAPQFPAKDNGKIGVSR